MGVPIGNTTAISACIYIQCIYTVYCIQCRGNKTTRNPPRRVLINSLSESGGKRKHRLPRRVCSELR